MQLFSMLQAKLTFVLTFLHDFFRKKFRILNFDYYIIYYLLGFQTQFISVIYIVFIQFQIPKIHRVLYLHININVYQRSFWVF